MQRGKNNNPSTSIVQKADKHSITATEVPPEFPIGRFYVGRSLNYTECVTAVKSRLSARWSLNGCSARHEPSQNLRA